ncbi:hypothetical protein B0J13DRAFT_666354 [Dactylonectria estremocensis]|uniref:Uncharacterized protein n=1 Tax=Dactylonectria estremocensis TaxID=1079267 RepID=A0A9P9EUV6_9HYPO|nr:hypothetical protein B0J13DRAFT_666354 [Dactylonectria estremocensis]
MSQDSPRLTAAARYRQETGQGSPIVLHSPNFFYPRVADVRAKRQTQLRECSTAEGRDPRVHREPVIEPFLRSPVPPCPRGLFPSVATAQKRTPDGRFVGEKQQKRGETSRSGVDVAGSSPICRAYADEASERTLPKLPARESGAMIGGDGTAIRPEDGQGACFDKLTWSTTLLRPLQRSQRSQDEVVAPAFSKTSYSTYHAVHRCSAMRSSASHLVPLPNGSNPYAVHSSRRPVTLLHRAEQRYYGGPRRTERQRYRGRPSPVLRDAIGPCRWRIA